MKNLENSELNLKHPEDLRCRICLLNDGNESLISPCKCKGTIAYVHLSCLERWLNVNGRHTCELCQYEFKVVQTPRYRMLEALRMWVRHPRIRIFIQVDLFIIVLLTFVNLGLIMVSLSGLVYFVKEETKLGMSQMWSTGAIIFFLIDLIIPWYRWWRRMVYIRLVLDYENRSEI